MALFKFARDESHISYQKNLEAAAVVALCLIILLFLLFPRFNISKEEAEIVFVASINVENIPKTHQGTRRKPPPKPAVPIPSDDDLIPDDITIEETDINFEQMSLQSGSGIADGRFVVFQPRPIYEVIPEYPQELQKQGIEGIVKLHLHIDKSGKVMKVIVLENTTGSNVCAKAAKTAALKGRYIPAKIFGKPTELWITRTYTFGLQK